MISSLSNELLFEYFTLGASVSAPFLMTKATFKKRLEATSRKIALAYRQNCNLIKSKYKKFVCASMANFPFATKGNVGKCN